MVCVVLVKEDLQTTLERRAPGGESGTASALASPWGPTGRDIPGLCPCAKSPGRGNLCPGARYGVDVVETGSLGAAEILSQVVVKLLWQKHGAPQPPPLPALPTLRITSRYRNPKCCSEA